VLEGLVDTRLKRFDKYLFAHLIEQCIVEALVEVLGDLELFVVDEVKYRLEHYHRLKDFTEIKTQTKPPLSRRVQKADRLVEMCVIYGGYSFGIEQGITERYESVYGIVWWAFDSFVEDEILR